ncbi:MAG: hypothetical protein A2145_07175 [candidate division Zixibacteria bacterium RBG_16_40_9]|nr:MAG: hypothetical protein A2145_07175 [candidate division Zixibacteria bacterium RBG_16_40_9]
MKIEKFKSPLKALSDLTRLKILLMLEGKPRAVSEIVEFFNLAQPTISRHLSVLKNVGLVKDKRAGQRVVYSLNTQRVQEICLGICDCFDCCKVRIK